VTDVLRKLWSTLRAVSGDDAYDRYLARWQSCEHRATAAPLDRKAFFKAEQRRKWEGVRRCC
jgi:hypothetical protein